MCIIDWVFVDFDKAFFCWLGGKDNRMVICIVFIFEIEGFVVFFILGINIVE